MQPLGMRIGGGAERLRALLRLPPSSRPDRRQRALTPARTLVTPAPTADIRRAEPVLHFRSDDGAPDGDFAAVAVPNARLRPETVPAPGAPWEAVEEFALSYDGYRYWSDVAELGNRCLTRWHRDRTVPGSLDELRGCLFFEQRRWHHFGEEPHGRADEYVRALLEALRALVTTTRPVARPGAPAGAAPHASDRPAAVRCFDDDDDGYLAWSAGHGDGFVLNAPRTRTAAGAKLHRARCASVTGAGGRSFTSGHRKVCASDQRPLLEWYAGTFGAEPDPCRRCRP